VAVALGLAGWLAVVASDRAAPWVLAAGAAGALATAVALRLPAALGLALVLSGGAYGLLLAIDDPPLDARAAGVAAALLVTGELVGWARELAGTTRDEPGNAWRRPVWIAAAGIGTVGLVTVLLAVVDVARVEGLAIEAMGAVAALAAVVVLVRMARPSARRAD
jgi:hypothetical protein